LYKIVVPMGLSVLKLVWRWSRLVQVTGDEYIADSLTRAPSFIPVYWHQHQVFCIKHLLDKRADGLKVGFLISPSVDGEIGAMLVRAVGAVAIRGSSTHTGARALRDYYQALSKEGVSPAITPDGPRGPPWKFKPGAVLLAQLSGRPMIPLSYAASRAWKIKWDSFVIPKPWARISLAVGEPVYVPKGLDAAGLELLQSEMEAKLKALFEQARAGIS
jgi:lysophospholipid acyltransferase (LPLAT)-like uncharacterized protein